METQGEGNNILILQGSVDSFNIYSRTIEWN